MLQQIITTYADIGRSLRGVAKARPSHITCEGKVAKVTVSHPSPQVSPIGRVISISDLEFRRRKRRMTKIEPSVCHSCGVTSTPEWRKGPQGPRTLCNGEALNFVYFVFSRPHNYQLDSLWPPLRQVGQEARRCVRVVVPVMRS